MDGLRAQLNDVDQYTHSNTVICFMFLDLQQMLISFRLRRKLGDINHQGPSLQRYMTVIRAIIESAILSWIATLSCAIAWTWSFGSKLDHAERVWVSDEIMASTLSAMTDSFCSRPVWKLIWRLQDGGSQLRCSWLYPHYLSVGSLSAIAMLLTCTATLIFRVFRKFLSSRV